MFTENNTETLIRFCRTSWPALKKILRKKYKDQDQNKQINYQLFLEAYKEKIRSDIFEVLQKCY